MSKSKPYCAQELEVYKCKLCQYETMWLVNLKKHVRKKACKIATPVELRCSECSFVTASEEHLSSHRKSHDLPAPPPGPNPARPGPNAAKQRKYKCTKCPFKTVWPENLITHALEKVCELAALIGFKCPECSFITTTEEYLNDHKKVHENADKDS